MRVYYCISSHDREFVYIPLVLLSYCFLGGKNPVHVYNPEKLNGLALACSQGKITKDRLEDKGWKVEEIEIPDKAISKFITSCFKRKSKRKLDLQAQRIFDRVQSLSEIYLEECFDDLPEVDEESLRGLDENDHLDDWWKRGDEPPEIYK